MKQQFYAFTFVESTPAGMAYASVYAAFDEPCVTLANIAYAKQGAEVSQAATLINCAYLRHMTSEQFNGV